MKHRWFLVLCVLVVLIGLIFVLKRPPSLQARAEDLIEGVMSGDAESVFAHMGPEERRISGLTKSQFTRFFDSHVAPRLSGFRLVGITEILPDGFDDLHLVVEREMVDGKGNRAVIGFDMIQTSEGPKCNTLVHSLIVLPRIFEGPDARARSGIVALRQRLAKLERLQRELEPYDIRGITTYSERGFDVQFLSWDAWRQMVEAHLNEAARLGAEQGRP